MTTLLAPEFTSRAPTHDDIPGILALTNASDTALIGQPYCEERTLREDWSESSFDLAKDARVVLSQDGQIVGYECILGIYPTGRIDIDGFVHPEFAGRGIGTYLICWSETRLRERLAERPTSGSHFIQTSTFGSDHFSRALLEAEGYRIVRHFWRMEIDLPALAPQWPDGISVRMFSPGLDERPMWAALNEIFAEEYNYVARSFEDWLTDNVPGENEAFDPALCFLAVEGETIVGVSRGMLRQGQGWIRSFGVRPGWRKRGVALALIRHTFNEFHRLGKTNVGLGVDSQNPTGATTFYERAGMRPTLTFDTYQKDGFDTL